MNLTGWRTQVSSIVGLDNSVAGDQGLIDGWVNEGVLDVVKRTESRVREFTMAMTSGSNTYTLDTNILYFKDLYNSAGGTDYPMTRVPPDYLNRMRRNTSGGSPPAQYYSIEGNDLLKLWPTPGASETLKGDYVARPTALASGSDTPTEIPVEYHPVVTYYVLWRAADYDDDSSSGSGQSYRQTYLQEIARMQHEMRKLNGNLGRVIINKRRRRNAPHDPSQFPPYV